MKLSHAIAGYLLRKRSGGLAYKKAGSQFMSLLKQVGDIQLGEVTTLQVLKYLDGPLTSTNTWIVKHSLLRNFFEFWTARGEMQVLLLPPPKPRVRQVFTPYVYSRTQIRLLIRATVRAQASESCSISAQTLRTLILVLYGTGARTCEILDLKRCDVDLRRRKLVLRRNRFNRVREIPIGLDLLDVLRKYLKANPADAGHCGHLFATKGGKPLPPGIAITTFQRLRKFAGVARSDQVAYHPRLHDLRYTFAVHRITSWIQNGADLNRMLPALAAYMGQFGLGTTERYLLLTPERFRKELNKLSPARGKPWSEDKALMGFLSSL